MSPPILQIRLSIPKLSSSNLSFSTQIVPDPTHLFITSNFSNLSIAKTPKSTPIRMGGGPRTFPGGVSKWQWKRMQAKKAKQLLRARLARERQIYEMRKRAELSAAVSELERPWEVVEKAPKLFSTSADEQLKVLADRFQKPGGFDLWSEKDGPQLFETVDGIPSARFFPKGVVHSIKPYGSRRITDGSYSDDDDESSREITEKETDIGYPFWDQDPGLDSGIVQNRGNNGILRNENENLAKNGNRKYHAFDQNLDPESGIGYSFWDQDPGLDSGFVDKKVNNGISRNKNENLANNGNRKHQAFDQNLDLKKNSVQRNLHEENPRNVNGKFMKNDRRIGGGDGLKKGSVWRKDNNGRKEESSRVFDMSLQDDGSYEILKKGMKMRNK